MIVHQNITGYIFTLKFLCFLDHLKLKLQIHYVFGGVRVSKNTLEKCDGLVLLMTGIMTPYTLLGTVLQILFIA